MKTMTIKQLQDATGVPRYIINYLRDNRRLPIVKESPRRGIPTLFHPDSINVILDHVARSKVTE